MPEATENEQATNDQQGQESQEAEQQAAQQQEQTASDDKSGSDEQIAGDEKQETALTANDQDAGDDKETGDDKEQQNTAPESYADVSLPEGFEISDKAMGSLTPWFQKYNIPKEGVEELMGIHADNVKATQAEQSDAASTVVQQWLNDAKADEEIGGNNFDAAVKSAKVTLEKFGTPELSKAFNDYGIGNHPEIIRIFAKIGKEIGEDNPGSGGGVQTGPQDRASQLYAEDGGVKQG
jgi:hypothetical protein